MKRTADQTERAMRRPLGCALISGGPVVRPFGGARPGRLSNASRGSAVV